MLYFTSYAEQKFDILNRHKIYFTREQIEDTILKSDEIEKRGKYFIARKDGIAVLYKKEKEIIKIITFYPIK